MDQSLWLVVALLFLPIRLPAQPAISKEYQIKAVFLYNFAQFVEWPATAFTNATAPICIGIVGDDPFGATLEETVRNESINNRKLVVHHVQSESELQGCHLIFVSKSEKRRLEEIFPKLNSRPVLTVGESDGFMRQGGVINFFLEDRKVRFEINPATAQQQGLRISSQLLSLAKIVKTAPGKESR